MSSLLDSLVSQHKHRAAALSERRAQLGALLLAPRGGVERALIAAGMPSLEADRLCNTGHGNPGMFLRRDIKALERELGKLERRIGGLRRWQEREAS